jgi:YidC/Oxa1 family membrane protein insertase
MLNDQDNQKNLLLAIVLSMAVLMAWQFLYVWPKQEQERQARIRIEQTKAKEKQAAPDASKPPEAKPGDTKPGAPTTTTTTAPTTAVASRQAALELSPRVGIEAPSFKGSIALKGGRIDDLVLAKYRDTIDPNSPNVVLFSPSRTPQQQAAPYHAPYYAEFGWIAGAGVKQPMPGSETLWRVEGNGRLTGTSPVTLVWDNGQGLVFRRTISVDDGQMFKVTDEVENKGDSAVSLYPYALLSRHGMPKVDGLWLVLHEGFVGAVGESGVQELGYDNVLREEKVKTFKQTGGWVGFTDKYWGSALVPDQKKASEIQFWSPDKGAKHFQADVKGDAVEIPAGGRTTVTTHLFAGAKIAGQIDAYGQQLDVRRFDMLIDWGYFWFLTKPLFMLLNWLSGVLGNYGLAILVTTVLVKGLLFPFANKSYASMAKMKLLQPEMEKLRERHKDDRAKMQQELMALYRERKINPAAGCLPVLLQVPVFFALYKVLYITIDMRQAPFFGWIKDLSAPDPTSIFNLFGLLPYAVPEFLHVGVWPIVMGATMWMQMQLNPQQADPMQQRIFNWMPVLFTFLLANFAAGLVIYWAWNNVLTLLQQYTIMKRNGAEPHLWKNLGIDKLAARVQAGGGGGSGGGGGLGDLVARGTASVRRGAERLTQTLQRTRAPAATLPAARAAGQAGDGHTGDGHTGDGHTGDGHAGDGAAAPQPEPKVLEMTREQALRTLGLQAGASASEIEAAYRARARQNGSLNGSERLSRARDVLRGGGGS